MALVIFDYDGVLADTLGDLIQYGQETCDELGVDHKVTQDDLSNLEVMSFTTYGQACGVPEHLVQEFARLCLKRFAEKTTPPALFNGLGDAVRRLAIRHKLAVVTTNTAHNVNAFLAQHGLDHFIKAVYGVEMPGSKAQKIIMAQDQLLKNEEQESAFMIGDSLSDMRAAKEAAVISIAVTWGHQSLETLLRGQPDHVIHAPHELLAIIES